jgi:hypothetical protein
MEGDGGDDGGGWEVRTINNRDGAIALLAILASQPEWEFGVWTLPGRFTHAQRCIAISALETFEVNCWDVTGDEWRCGYATAEAVLRDWNVP